MKAISDAVLACYRERPAIVREHMPSIAEALDKAYPCSPGRPMSRVTLTERERQFRVSKLQETLTALEMGKVSQEDALRAVEDSLVLASEFSLPEAANHKALTRLIEMALGRELKTSEADYVVNVSGRESERVAASQSIVRGVLCDLTWDHRVIRISVFPGRVREWGKAMAFIGRYSPGNCREQSA
ncbi:MAG TPA: hypothetical protein PLE19_08940 [Planctomycetota bacterium]|nr:hypothetical protein [Planctomycetota bacterium]HRR80400.1 hypothetical protein [Planctomycetota bacterium]HRT95379.1 hypothetical protein [Planctomycetota bacterium]